MTTTRTIPAIRTQVASALPSDDSGWQARPQLRAVDSEEGCAEILGSSTLLSWYGESSLAGTDDGPYQLPDQTPDYGQLVRIVRVDVNPLTYAETIVPLWHGFVDHIERQQDLRTARIGCVGLAGILARSAINRGWEIANDSSVIDPGYFPIANGIAGGDRSTTKPDGISYVHDRISATRASWNASDLTELLLRRATWAQATSEPTTIRWRLGDLPGSADYVPPPIDLHGRTIAEALNELWNTRRGLTWRVRVSGDIAYIDVINLAGVGADVDLVGDQLVENVEVQDASDPYDIIMVQGTQPLVGVTLRWKVGEESTCALIPDGWTPGATADAALDAAMQTAALADNPQPYLAKEWRTFKINPLWNGISHGAINDGLRAKLNDDGTRTWQNQIPAPTALQIERSTPWGEGGTTDLTGPRQGPAVIASSDSTTFVDLTKTNAPSPLGGVPPGGTTALPAGIALGDSAENADQLRTMVGASGELRVTIAIREWAPLSVVWRQNESEWPIQGFPRVLVRKVSGCELWRGAAGATLGINPDGTPRTISSEQIIRDDTQKLTDLLDRLTSWHGSAHGRARWTSAGSMATAFKAGDLIKSIAVTADQTADINAPLTRIRRTYDPLTAGTTYECIPIAPDLTTLL